MVCERLPSPVPACPVIQVCDSRYALSALADAYFGSPSRSLRATGITGTDGKTSTTYILRAILAEAGHSAGAIGTLGYAIGESVLDSDLTTPGPIPLHEAFDRMLKAGLTDVCMEVSSHALVHRRTAHVQFDAAVLTNVTEDHLDFHKSPQAYVRAKQCLFEHGCNSISHF